MKIAGNMGALDQVDLAWIGMMLVDPELRRHGIATALMETAIGYLHKRNVACIKLDATPEGEFVYSKLGFEEEWTFERWRREACNKKQSESYSKKRSSTSFSSIDLEVDCQTFGADRREFLTRLASDSSTVFEEGGFGMARNGHLASYLGPVIANTPMQARSIVQELIGPENSAVFWDIPGPNREAENIARDLGFTPVRTLKRMGLGNCSESADLSMLFALADPATG